MSRGGSKSSTRRRGRTSNRDKTRKKRSRSPETEPSLVDRLDMWLSRLPGLSDSAGGSQDSSRTSSRSNKTNSGEAQLGMRRSEDVMLGGARRKKNTATTNTVVIFATLCAALLWVGVVSLSRGAQLTSGTGTNTTRRTEQGKTAISATSPAGSSQASSAPQHSSVPRKLSRRPELKTRGGQLAFARYSLLAEFPHDPAAFTQGLSFYDGYVYESTGLLGGKSSIRRVEVETGNVVQIVNLAKDQFGEGMVILEDKIYSLTWRSRVGFTWDLKTFQQKKQFQFTTKTGQGWGITTDGESLIVSDGSQFLFFWDPQTMLETKRIEITHGDGRPLSRINELEMVKGYVFANVWFDDAVYKIDPNTGSVVDTYNFAELYPKALQKKELASKEAVLNGIAWDPVEDVLYLTGKLWPRMYKVKLHEGEAKYEVGGEQGETEEEEDEEGEKIEERKGRRRDRN